MRFDILTLFPEAVTPYTSASILGKAIEGQHIAINVHNIRDYTVDKHRTTDDTPYGGGAGMVMKVEPIHQALLATQKTIAREEQHIIVLSARGTPFTQQKAQELSRKSSLVLICGRYEGVDQRVRDHFADEELSIGPYVLAGGELAALVVVETVARLLPGVLGNPESLTEESFTLRSDASPESPHQLEYPQYTKPEDYLGFKVPPVLLTGNHQAIKKWRQEQQRP